MFFFVYVSILGLVYIASDTMLPDLLPPWFSEPSPSAVDMNLVSIIFGVSLATATFSGTKAFNQTWVIWKRKKEINAYVVLIWLEWTANLGMSIILWLYMWRTVKAGFLYFFMLLVLWSIQTQCILQIIINRVALLTRDQARVRRIKWTIGLLMGLINTSVFCIWIPARMQISETYMHVNEIWDRIEKVLYCLLDLGLNIYFIYNVRSKLVNKGLKKYDRLFKFNLVISTCSVSLDIINIGLMSLGTTSVYLQFQGLLYMLKLQIEMKMADFIAKIVRAERTVDRSLSSSETMNVHHSNPQAAKTSTNIMTGRPRQMHADDEDVEAHPARPNGGIRKTVETLVFCSRANDRTT